ncbi:trehalase family glycosidase, partial [Halorubrum sp. AJ67]|uniref:trehalase family glycosidase n=1 Tax=Halorubrum sp. AJ67 TaxID=1173487 RepID=UPI001E5594A5
MRSSTGTGTTAARPRPESYHEDRRLADRVPVDDRPDLFRDVRAACESGWDFSSR